MSDDDDERRSSLKMIWVAIYPLQKGRNFNCGEWTLETRHAFNNHAFIVLYDCYCRALHGMYDRYSRPQLACCMKCSISRAGRPCPRILFEILTPPVDIHAARHSHLCAQLPLRRRRVIDPLGVDLPVEVPIVGPLLRGIRVRDPFDWSAFSTAFGDCATGTHCA